jgi:hypothetical protein
VPVSLGFLLGCLVAVTLTGAHLAAAVGLAVWLTPSPLPPASPAQVGKLGVYVGLAALASCTLLLVRQAARLSADRRLIATFACLLLPGGGLYVVLDLAPAFGFETVWLGPAEQLVKWGVLCGCGLLVGRRLLTPPADAAAWPPG